MRSIKTILATALVIMSMAAFMPDSQAQTRRSSGTSRSSSTSDRSSTQTSRPSSTSRPSTQTVKPSGKTTRPASGTVTRPASGQSSDRRPGSTATRPSTQPSTTVTRPSTGTSRPSTVTTRPTTVTPRPSSGTATRPSSDTPSRPATGTAASPSTGTQTRPSSGNPITRPINRPEDKKPGGEAMRPDLRPDRPVQVRPDHRPNEPRVHPRDRDFMHFSRPSYYWTGHNHYYGYRVRVLPSYAHRYVYHGVTYYCYNDIWYRPYGGYYVVCRPPFGTVLAANLIADMTWASVRLSYYYTVANTYSQINENNQYIAEQNALIAQNNAIIAQQNEQIAAGQQQAQMAYSLAAQLGLVQSYAAAGTEYYYQDGVFYVMDASGEYKVIVPPAGALVETLSEDFDMVTLADGNEYYKVDDTVYRVVVLEGKPYFEVLGQLYV